MFGSLKCTSYRNAWNLAICFTVKWSGYTEPYTAEKTTDHGSVYKSTEPKWTHYLQYVLKYYEIKR